MEQDPITREIIGAAIDSHRELGPGLLEFISEHRAHRWHGCTRMNTNKTRNPCPSVYIRGAMILHHPRCSMTNVTISDTLYAVIFAASL